MSFFSQLKDEVNDKNIDKAKLKELTKTIREEPAEQAEAPQKKRPCRKIRNTRIIRIISR